jgi:hypothetical protein
MHGVVKEFLGRIIAAASNKAMGEMQMLKYLEQIVGD